MSETDTAYQVYLDMVKDYLQINGKRLLTEKEEEIVTAHLVSVAMTFENESEANERGAYPDIQGIARRGTVAGLNITQRLSVETARKVSEIHPDIPTPTPEMVEQRVAEVVAVQNFLQSDTDVKKEESKR